MKIAQITPGSGNTFYCENCLRDAGLARALRGLGHDAMVVPLYLPLSVDRADRLTDVPVFFGGVNVYLQQKFGLFRRTPRWLDRLFDSPRLLRWAAGKAGMTSPEDLAETTLSMLQGSHGRQAKELDRLVEFLAADGPPEVVCLSNALLLGMAVRIKRRLGSAVVCLLQDEDSFLDMFPAALAERAWEELARCAEHVDAFIAASRYYAGAMAPRMRLPDGRVHVVPLGVDPGRFTPAPVREGPPAIGFLSRLCPERGLDALAEAFIQLKSGGARPELKLRVAGGWTGEDVPFIRRVRRRLRDAGLTEDVEFLPILDGPGREAFLRSLSVLSVPGAPEAFGLYILEALACGVPVVQPAHGGFVEVVQETGGGVLVPPGDPGELAAALADLLSDRQRAASLGSAGREAVERVFNEQTMACGIAEVCLRIRPARAMEP